MTREVVGRRRVHDSPVAISPMPWDDRGVNIHLHGLTTDQVGTEQNFGQPTMSGSEGTLDRHRDDRHRDRHLDRHRDEEEERRREEEGEDYEDDGDYNIKREADGSLTVRHRADDRPRLRFRKRDNRRHDEERENEVGMNYGDLQTDRRRDARPSRDASHLARVRDSLDDKSNSSHTNRLKDYQKTLDAYWAEQRKNDPRR